MNVIFFTWCWLDIPWQRSVGDVNDTAAPSEPTVKIQSQAQQVDYTVNRSSENGDSTIGSARAPSVWTVRMYVCTGVQTCLQHSLLYIY